MLMGAAEGLTRQDDWLFALEEHIEPVCGSGRISPSVADVAQNTHLIFRNPQTETLLDQRTVNTLLITSTVISCLGEEIMSALTSRLYSHVRDNLEENGRCGLVFAR